MSTQGPQEPFSKQEIEDFLREGPHSLAILASKGKWMMPWHLEVLSARLTDIATGGLNRLIVMMPPRHGKSELVSKYFPAWYLMLNPDKRVILASYEADFASQWGRKVRQLIADLNSPRFRVVFGESVTIRGDSKAADRWEIEGHAGGMQTAGVGGPITGKGADILIIDDPVKNAEEANSDVHRDKAWDWYVSTAYTRLEPGGAVVLVMTRWHEDDLAGRVLKQAESSGEHWHVLNLPAIAMAEDERGHMQERPLWPDRYPLSRLEEIRKAIPPYWWEALYQQAPVPPGGDLFKKSWFKYWKWADEFRRSNGACLPGGDFSTFDLGGKLVRLTHCRTFATMDLAFSTKKESDFTVIAAWAVSRHGDLILLDLVRERMEAHALIPAARALCNRWDCQYIGIEEVLGASLVTHGARMEGLTVRALRADKDKVTRSIPAQVRMQAGQIWFPEQAMWLREFEHELVSFPRGTHDDQVDCLSYAAAEVQRFGSAPGPDPEEIDSRRRSERESFESLLMGES